MSKTSILINRPLPVVWETFTTPANWQAWWGGGLLRVVPGWESGATLFWQNGDHSTLEKVISQQEVTIPGKWLETVYRFSAIERENTRVEVEFIPHGGASFSDGGKGYLADMAEALKKLKQLVEQGKVEAAPQVISEPAEKPALPEMLSTPRLTGRQLLVLMSSMLGLGFLSSLIPCLSISSFFAGGLGAWFWLRSERALPSLATKRGAFAGLLVGLGASPIGVLFFLNGLPGLDFNMILQGITTALMFFMLPAGVGGVLAGLVLGRRAARNADLQPLESAAGPVVQPFSQPRLADAVVHPSPSILRNHTSLLLAAKTGTLGLEQFQGLSAQLLAGEPLDFVLSAIERELAACLEKKTIVSDTRILPGWLLAVTICPYFPLEEIRASLPGGYLNLLNQLSAPAYHHPGKLHVAHWMYCSDGLQARLFLTFIPSPETALEGAAVAAEELLTAQEKAQLGI